uniref:Uncharacterized protein n=1 Tax=Crocodylus porosus TaxID=8502 RepID=A0A7M4G019_CROPO
MFSAALNCPGTVHLTVLNCDVEEKNIANKEFYTLLWEDLTMETRQQERTALLERNSVCHEKYEKQQQDTFLVQRSPYLNIQMGRLGEQMRQYQLPYKNVLPVPLFMPCKGRAHQQGLAACSTLCRIKGLQEPTEDTGLYVRSAGRSLTF